MRIQDLLTSGQRPILTDGACGTYYRLLSGSNTPCELANLQQPQQVLKLHNNYLAAGAQVLYTNTFAAGSLLAQDEARLLAVYEAGWALACQAAGNEAAVLADIGCINYQGAGLREEEEAAARYLRLAELFCQTPATDFVFETMASFTPLIPALQYVRHKRPDAFILVTFAVSQDGYSKKGLYYKDLLDAAFACADVSAAGLNCVCGPGHMLQLLADYPFQGRLLAALPNAGYPLQVNQRLVYEDNVDYYALRLSELAALGCALVGGCCGSTPAHIAQTAAKLAASSAGIADRLAVATPIKGGFGVKETALTVGIDTARPSAPDTFLSKLHRGQRVTVVELNPPISRDVEHFMAAARQARAAGADVVSVTDSPLARARADSLMLAAKLQRELGVEVLPHLSCRDRNRLGLKSALLAAAIEDVRQVLAVRGDASDEGVFSLNSRELMAFIGSLNRELLAEGGITCGGALNINVPNFAAELRRAQAKVEAGCAFFLTQPVFDERGVSNVAQAVQELKAPVLAGLLPLASYKNALFLQQEVGGINIPPSLLQSLQDKDAVATRVISLNHCRAMMKELEAVCAGFYFMTPLNRIEWVCELVAEVSAR